MLWLDEVESICGGWMKWSLWIFLGLEVCAVCVPACVRACMYVCMYLPIKSIRVHTFLYRYLHVFACLCAPCVSSTKARSEKTISDTFELKRQLLHTFWNVDAASVLCGYVVHDGRQDSRPVVLDESIFWVQLQIRHQV